MADRGLVISGGNRLPAGSFKGVLMFEREYCRFAEKLH
jgi:hypothetical protein